MSLPRPGPSSMPSPPDLAVIGHGRFGAALCDLAERAGLRVVAHDPAASVPVERAVSLEAAASARFVALAVPVDAVGTTAAALRPHLGPGSIVFDVGSVKLVPTAALRAELGDAHAWVPTHPLFGPASLARGERPLRVVVCATDTPHTDAAESVCALFERLGCDVHRLDADAHDRAMARTHALAFFVARGVLEGGFDIDDPLAPPSFRAMATTVRTVREDAGHLFDVLHRLNPHAASVRAEYRAALDRIARALGDE
jgi:prephenate dehydrogenase